MPTVEIKDAQTTLVDGVNYGSVADAIRNNPQLTADIQVALSSRLGDLITKDSERATLKAENDSLKQQLNLPPNPGTRDYRALYSGIKQSAAIKDAKKHLDNNRAALRAYVDLGLAVVSQSGIQEAMTDLLSSLGNSNFPVATHKPELRSILDKAGFTDVVI